MGLLNNSIRVYIIGTFSFSSGNVEDCIDRAVDHHVGNSSTDHTEKATSTLIEEVK